MELLTVDLSPKEKRRIFAKVEKTSSCWHWMGSRDEAGYGLLWYRGKTERAHRIMYAYLVSPIPRGMAARKLLQINHTCRNTSCCNPKHLELVSQMVNMRTSHRIVMEGLAKTHCIHGHRLEKEKTRNRRYCPTCDSIRHKKRLRGDKREYWLKKGREAARRWYTKNRYT